jgi:DNA-binding NarL/FixJ family response regulator
MVMDRELAMRRWSMLTPRQQEVVDLVAAGLTNREIAARLGLTAGTVSAHVANSLWRLGLKRRAQIVLRAIEPAGRSETTDQVAGHDRHV